MSKSPQNSTLLKAITPPHFLTYKLIFSMLALLTTIGSFAQITGTGTVNFIPKFTGSTTVGNSNIFQNGNYIGLFTTSPAATLEVGASCGTSNIGTIVISRNNSFICSPGLSRGEPFVIRELPLGASIYETRFIVNSTGKVGIGTGSPAALLDVLGTSTAAKTLQARNAAGNTIYSVLGNGNMGIGNITPTYLLDINGQQAGATQPPLRIVNSVGNTTLVVNSNNRVGINLTNPDTYGGSLVVAAYNAGQNTLDLVSTVPSGWGNLIRFFDGINPRHVIADDRDNNQLVIDPGYSGGAGNKLKIDGVVDITRSTNIGLSLPSTNTSILSLKGVSNTFLDLYQTSNTSWNTQIRFLNTAGLTRHVITEDNNDLLIDVGFGAGGNDKLKIAGNMHVTGKLQIGTQAITSGTHADAQLFVDGKIAAKSCVVTTNSWADDVFSSNYNLVTLEELSLFIKKNKHLPEVASEQEACKMGINVSEVATTLLRKIEELTLYSIELNQRIKQLERKK